MYLGKLQTQTSWVATTLLVLDDFLNPLICDRKSSPIKVI